MSTLSANTNTTKLHPHKLLMYIAIGSMTMMFAGWISAYMVRQGQGRWEHVHLPTAFYVSTVLILISSVTIFLSVRAHKKQKYSLANIFLLTTLLLGVAFIGFQIQGFVQMRDVMGISLNGNNAAGEFTYVIPFVHGLHVVGGVLALLFTLLVGVWRRKANKKITSRGLEIAATFWHFVDALWLFIFIFLLYNQQA